MGEVRSADSRGTHRARGRPWVAVLAGGWLLIGCSATAPRPEAPFVVQESTTRTSSPVAVGMEQLIGGADLELAVPGPVVLTRVELPGLTGPGDVRIYVTDGPSHLGTEDREASARDRLDGPYQPLDGKTLTGAGSTYGVVVGVVTATPGITRWDSVQVDYTVDGTPGSQLFKNAGMVCAMESPLERCPDLAS
ncbi:MAG: hypothetical protein U0869_04170 [Chloroflexota bacterium]